MRIWGSRSQERQDLPSSESSDKPSAAVTVVLKPGSDPTPDVLLLKRQTVERDPWSGQVSLPGGRSKDGETAIQTAKRETMEETKIDLEKCELIGMMQTIYPGNFSIRVTPFVVVALEDVVVQIDREEIIDFFWVPLGYFADQKNSSVYTFSREGRTIRTQSFVLLGKYVVWGMTLRIIQNLLSELQRD